MDLDRWLADPLIRTHHRRNAAVGPEHLWATAKEVRLRDCRVLGRLIRARIPGLRSSETFEEMFAAAPFNVLDEGPTFRMSGLVGRIWTVRGDFALLAAPEDFVTWDEPGTVRVLFANWVEETGPGPGSALVSEVRVQAVDRRAAFYTRGLGPFISAFQSLVGTEALTVAARRAQAR